MSSSTFKFPLFCCTRVSRTVNTCMSKSIKRCTFVILAARQIVSGPTFRSSSSDDTLLRIRPCDHSRIVFPPCSTITTALSVSFNFPCKRLDSSSCADRTNASSGRRGSCRIGSRGSELGHSTRRVWELWRKINEPTTTPTITKFSHISRIRTYYSLPEYQPVQAGSLFPVVYIIAWKELICGGHKRRRIDRSPLFNAKQPQCVGCILFRYLIAFHHILCTT